MVNKRKLKKDGTPKKAGGSRKNAGRKKSQDPYMFFNIKVRESVAIKYGDGRKIRGFKLIKEKIQHLIDTKF